MTIFEIRDQAAEGMLLGYLFYYDRSRRFYAELLKETDEWTAPFMFAGQVKRGIYSIDSVWSYKFVAQRIIPPDRQNLGSILRENGLKEYNEFRLLQLSEGRCAQDELYLVKVSEEKLLPEVKDRLKQKVLDVMPLKNRRMLVFFRNGESRSLDIKKLCQGNRAFDRVLREDAVYENVRVSPGGNGIEWDEERYLPAERLLSEGKRSEVSHEDLMLFVKERLMDSAEAAGLLHCTRQYVKQLADRERLIPIREEGNANLFLKCSLESEWRGS